MLIIGASGFAQEILEIFHEKGELNNLAFYDDINTIKEDKLYNKFPVLKNHNQVIRFFESNGNEFVIGIGNPELRSKMYEKFTLLGGRVTTFISLKANIGSYNVNIGDGVIILSGVNVSNNVSIGKGSMIYYNSNITHDCKVGDFVEISPSVNLLGRVEVGSYSNLGTNCTILPNIKIGSKVVVGAGSVVTKNIPDNTLVMGVPARIIRNL